MYSRRSRDTRRISTNNRYMRKSYKYKVTRINSTREILKSQCAPSDVFFKWPFHNSVQLIPIDNQGNKKETDILSQIMALSIMEGWSG